MNDFIGIISDMISIIAGIISISSSIGLVRSGKKGTRSVYFIFAVCFIIIIAAQTWGFKHDSLIYRLLYFSKQNESTESHNNELTINNEMDPLLNGDINAPVNIETNQVNVAGNYIENYYVPVIGGVNEELLEKNESFRETKGGQSASDNIEELSYGWNDSDGGRDSYTIADVNNGVLGERIIFNSIRNSSIGDERNFVAAREDKGINQGTENIWKANTIKVEEGRTYYVRIYVHNNSPMGYEAVAENVKVQLNIPSEAAKNVAVTGYIFADNAEQEWYSDTVVFQSDNRFSLEYDTGSAFLENNGFSPAAVELSDEIIKSPILIGYDTLDGKIPGCFQYDAYITIRIRPVFIDGDNLAADGDNT